MFLDITGLLTSVSSPPAGIRRVELDLLDEAINRGNIGFVAFEWPRSTCRPVSGRLARQLADHLHNRDRTARWTLIWRIFRFGYRFGRNDTARELARLALGARSRMKFLYQLAKSVFRILIWVALSIRLATDLMRRLLAPSDGPAPGDIALISYETGRLTGYRKPLFGKGALPAFIIYDLMPLKRPEFSFPDHTGSMKSLLTKAMANNDFIISISETVKDDIDDFAKDLPAARDRRPVKPIGLGNTRIHDLEFETPISELQDEPFVLFCSSIEAKKGHDILVAAWQLLIDRLGSAAVPMLAFIGRRSTGYERYIAAVAANPDAGGKIIHLNDVSDEGLRWAYRNASFSLFASRYEGWGLGVSESLGFGLPVIHSPIPSLREAAQGIMPEPSDDTPEAWAEAVAPLLRDHGRIQALRDKIIREYKTVEHRGFARSTWNYLESANAVSRTGGR